MESRQIKLVFQKIFHQRSKPSTHEEIYETGGFKQLICPSCDLLPSNSVKQATKLDAWHCIIYFVEIVALKLVSLLKNHKAKLYEQK